MGTSSSYRAPSTPRWNAFLAALTSGAAPDRLRSELFNAGNEWEEGLAVPAIAQYAATLTELYESLPDLLVGSGQIASTIVEIATNARRASEDVGFSPVLQVADRALIRLLIRGVNGPESIAESDRAAVDNWIQRRGESPVELVSRFARELIAEYTRHVVEREAGRLIREKPQQHGSDIAISLAEAAGQIALTAARDQGDTSSTPDGWASLIHRAFSDGRILQPNRQVGRELAHCSHQ